MGPIISDLEVRRGIFGKLIKVKSGLPLSVVLSRQHVADYYKTPVSFLSDSSSEIVGDIVQK